MSTDTKGETDYASGQIPKVQPPQKLGTIVCVDKELRVLNWSFYRDVCKTPCFPAFIYVHDYA